MICESIATMPGTSPSNFVSGLKGGLSIDEINTFYNKYIQQRKQDGTYDALAKSVCQRLRYEEHFTREKAAYILCYSLTNMRRIYDNYVINNCKFFLDMLYT